jgi:hypothetical protein
MIDYDKLKLAHELAEKYYNKTGESITIEHNSSFGCYVVNPFKTWINQLPYTFESLDLLLCQLVKLTKSDESKLNTQECPIECPLCGQLSKNLYPIPKYEGDIESFKYDCQHEYKKTLAKSGICFINMCHKCNDEQPFLDNCKHESDGLTYGLPFYSREISHKCKKCSEFYVWKVL